MNSTSNKQKFEIFIEVCRDLNKLDIIPVLYGSLGLYRVIHKLGKVNDIDILVPVEFLNKKWISLNNLMKNLDFELKDEHEREFLRKGEIVAFGNEKDLSERAQIDPKALRISKIDNIKFKELSPEQYLAVYQFMLRDKYRQEKLRNADWKKINLIKAYMEKPTPGVD